MEGPAVRICCDCVHYNSSDQFKELGTCRYPLPFWVKRIQEKHRVVSDADGINCEAFEINALLLKHKDINK